MRRAGGRGVPRRDGGRRPTPVTVASILGSTYYADFDARQLSSSPVASWPNLGLDGAAAVQATGSKQPVWSATSFNGGPGVTGDGVDDFLVATVNNAIANGARPYAWFVGQATALDAATYAACVGSTNLTVFNAANNWSVQFNGGGLTSLGALDTNRHLLEMSWTGIEAGFLDGVSAPGGAPPFPGATKLSLFASINGSQAGNVRCARYIVANSLPSGAQVTALRAYLRGANFPGYSGNSYGLP